MTGAKTNRVDVAFEALRYPDGRPFIALLLPRDRDRHGERERLFSLDLNPSMTVAEAQVLAAALNRCVTHIGLTTRTGDGSPAG